MAAADFEPALPPEPVGGEAPEQQADDLVTNGAAPPVEETEPPLVPRGLYLVRVPKPPMDESELKRLQADFQAAINKLKGLNAKLQAARDVVRGFKRQMGEARGLKETSEPEFQEKSGRMKELRNARDRYIERINEIKASMRGIECKSEEELEEKIRVLEHRIAHESLPLREEKQAVQAIARLNAQRGRIKEYDTHRATLAELETECQKVKAIISGMEAEYGVIKAERDATKDLVQGIYVQLDAAQKELAVLETEHADLVAAKEEALRRLDAARDEANGAMAAFRSNRKFALTVRDLVAAGDVVHASNMVEAQVDEWVNKLSSDATLREEYVSLWAGQRRYMVSELLPESSSQAASEAAARGPPAGGKAAAGGRGGRGGGGARGAPLIARGAEKAKTIIEQLMQEASAEAAAAKAGKAAAHQHVNGGSDGDAEDDDAAATKGAPKAAHDGPYRPPGAAAAAATGQAAASSAPAAPARLVQDPAAAAAAAFGVKVALPDLGTDDAPFVPPVIKADAADAPRKEALRQEQAKKAAEAEERKRRRAEAAERKRATAAEAARKLEAERRERDAVARAAAAATKAAASGQAVAGGAVGQDEEALGGAGGDAAPSATVLTTDAPASVPGTLTVAQERAGKVTQPGAGERRQKKAVAKRPRPSRSAPLRQARSFWNQYQAPIILAVVLLLTAILGLLYFL